jgi:hypothetical protein
MGGATKRRAARGRGKKTAKHIGPVPLKKKTQDLRSRVFFRTLVGEEIRFGEARAGCE